MTRVLNGVLYAGVSYNVVGFYSSINTVSSLLRMDGFGAPACGPGDAKLMCYMSDNF